MKTDMWMELPPTPRQIFAIARMSIALRLPPSMEIHLPRTRKEARDTIYDLGRRLKLK